MLILTFSNKLFNKSPQNNCLNTKYSQKNFYDGWKMNEKKTMFFFKYLNTHMTPTNQKKTNQKNNENFINIERAFTASPPSFLVIMCTSLPFNQRKIVLLNYVILNLCFFLLIFYLSSKCRRVFSLETSNYKIFGFFFVLYLSRQSV